MEEKKKILHIVEAFGGGVFSMLSDLVNGIDNNYDNVIAYSERKETPQNYKEYFNKNTKFIKVNTMARKISFKNDLKALKELKRIIKEEKPDVIHLHSSKAGILGRLAISGRKVKMFYNPHGFSFLKQDDSKIKRKIYWIIEKFIAIINRNCTIVGCSKGEYEEAKKLSKNSICINNGIDTKKLKESITKLKKEIDIKNLKICTVGRLGYQKNPQLFNEIAKQFPNLQFTWIGDGELKNELTSKNIKITGWQDRKNVLKLLNENDIFLLTSLWEGLPISLLEAMYLKKICIVSDVIGNQDVIINEENGFLCRTLEDFTNTINNIECNNYHLAKVVNNANEDVEKMYSTEAMSENYIKCYES